jgi:hypothetical protein
LKKVIPLIIGFFFLAAFGAAWAEDTEVVHTVKKGDTLWDISNKYLKTPWKWPLVWAENDKITNPHLIYPGDKVVILSKDGKISIKIIPVDQTAGERVFSVDQLADIKGHSIVISPGYSTLIYSEKPLKTKGSVASKVDIGFLSTKYDKILVKGYPDAKPGKGLIIKTLQNSVKIDPRNDLFPRDMYDSDRVDDTIYGYLYRISALATVDSIDKDIAICSVTYSYQEINKDDPVDDDISSVQPVTINPSENRDFENAIVIQVWNGCSSAGNGDIIFIDKGSANGLKQGNVLNIYKAIPLKEGKTVKNINAYAGNALVLQTIEKSAMLLVTYSIMDIQAGFVVSGK